MTGKKEYKSYMAMGGLIALVSLIGSSVMGFVIRMILARSLTPADYGLFFGIITFLGLFSIFHDLGLTSALGKFIPQFRTEGDYDRVRSSILTSLTIESFVVMVFVLMFVVLSGWLSLVYFDSPIAQTIIMVLCIWFSFGMLNAMFKKIFRGFRDILSLGVAKLLNKGFILIPIVLAVVIFDAGITGVAWSYSIGAVFAAGLFMLLLKRRHSKLISGSWNLDFPLGKKLLIFGLPLWLAGLTAVIMKKIDTLMIMAFYPSEVVGLYEVAKPIVGVIPFLGVAIAKPLLPMISELQTEKKLDKVKTTLQILTKYSVILVILAAFLLLGFMEPIIRIVFTTEYLAAASAARILTIGMSFYVGIYLLGSTLVGMGDRYVIIVSKILPLVFNVAANFILIPLIGIEGAAISTTISIFLMLVIRYKLMKDRVIHFPFPYKTAFKALLGGGISLGIIWILQSLLSPLKLFEIVSIAILISIFYSLWILKTRAIDEQDLKLIEESTPIPARVIKFIKKLA